MNKEEISRFLESFVQGSAVHAAEYLGSHLTDTGAVFRVWAPNAVEVFVSGSFNNWSERENPMHFLNGGIWELEILGVKLTDSYKYVICSRDGQTLWKADPYAKYAELRPVGASRLYDFSAYQWQDSRWMKSRKKRKIYDHPLNIYELHFASWRTNEDGSSLTYRQMADELIPYIKEMNFTHVEFMPLTEYPFDGSWGYQVTGYFAATSRYGTPEDLMYLIDALHNSDIGVIMDWVPAHFPKDPHGLVEFDGTRLYEDSDPTMAEHPSWGTRIFDYAKGEVRSFLISSALFWLEQYHIDGLRVDAVASILYLDYDRHSGTWRRNKFGGNENLEAVEFLKALNVACFSYDDSILMIAEESTAWPLVTGPAHAGGLGFNLKWNMGWMNDTLRYLKTDPLFRAGSHNDLSFSLMYAFSENFVLPLSHDEVVHMKGSLIGKAPGTREQKLSNVRAFWAYMLAHPGKKLLFMGAELGQETEWDYASQLPWDLLQFPDKAALHDYFKAANGFYLENRPLWSRDFDAACFSWLCADERDNNILAFTRKDKAGKELTFLCSFSGSENKSFRLGVTSAGHYTVCLSTDEASFGGSGKLTSGQSFTASKIPQHGQSHSILIDIPPLTAIFLRRTRPSSTQPEKSVVSQRKPKITNYSEANL